LLVSIQAWSLQPLSSSGLETHAKTWTPASPANIQLPCSRSDSVRPPVAAQSSALHVSALIGFSAILASLSASRRRRQNPERQRCASVVVRADGDELELAFEDPETGEKNYVNPWEKYVELTEEQRIAEAEEEQVGRAAEYEPLNWKFHKYEGPVYKKVPVVEGLSFPLDPNVYYPPLEPPPVGAKWGDGRSPDGNWYMDIEGEKVQYWQGWGRRKTSCAIVRLVRGTGQFRVNGVEAIEFFRHYPIWWLKACEPLAALSVKNDFDLLCKAFGGGVSGQAGAIRHAVARALEDYNYEYRPLLKKAKYLVRDWRMSEAKKIGRHSARKKKPYHKR